MRATSEVSRRPPRGTRSVCVAQRGMSTGNGHMPAHLVCLCDAQLRAPVLCFAQEQPGSTPSTNGAHTHAHTHAHREWNGPTMSTISLRLSRSSCRPRTPPTPHTSSTAPAATWRRPARMLPVTDFFSAGKVLSDTPWTTVHAADSGTDACTENTNTAVAASCRV